MFSRIQSAQLSGVRANGVIVETDISRGLFLFQIVGLADKAVEESRERVISALRNNCSINPKALNEKVIVSLSPAEVRKEGSHFDLAIAVGYLSAAGLLQNADLNGAAFVGELALNGELQPVNGLLAIVQWAKASGIAALYVPQKNSREASMVDNIAIYLVPTLSDLAAHFTGIENGVSRSLFEPPKQTRYESEMDFSAVRGQESAKRALMIAAAGGHNIVLYGPPGTGKTMLAKAFHSILPPLAGDEFLEVATIYSSAGMIDETRDCGPPIRSPHHTASFSAVIGGGSSVRPGDITLAHRGVLYMDEFPEFDRRVIEALREPLEEGCITISRSKGSNRFPACFILLAAMNPCPCGYRGSSIRSCTCSGAELARYSRKLSGPIMDRIDLWVPVSNIEYETLHDRPGEKESPTVTRRVAAARHLQQRRGKKLNGMLSSAAVREMSGIADAAKSELQRYAERFRLSPRAYLRTIKVARTIADLAESSTIELPHLLEALQYRQRLE